MNKIKSFALLASCYLLTLSSPASAVMVSDVIDASSGQPGTYFVPAAANPYDLPYFRYQGEDWEWQHNAIANTINTAELSISAWDVDNPSTFPRTRPDEIDRIQAFNNDTASWETVGELVDDARLGQGVRALEKPFLQEADLLRVEAPEAPNRVDALASRAHRLPL